MICPNQPLHCDAYSRFGSAGDPLRWYSSQPAKCGPLTSHRSRLPSDVRMNAPLRVPTNTRTPLIAHSFSSVVKARGTSSPENHAHLTCEMQVTNATVQICQPASQLPSVARGVL